MAALTLNDMLARVKKIVPTTVIDTELQDAILERMNYLASLDVFPFQEGYQSSTLTSGNSSMSTPDNFASQKSLIIYTVGAEKPLSYLDPREFDRMFPNPTNNSPDSPDIYTIKIAESLYYFNCPADQDYTIYSYFHKVPDDVTNTSVSQLSELAKLTIIDWAAADGFRYLKEFDRAAMMEQSGDKKFNALKRRYQLSIENDARFVSAKEAMRLYRGY